VIQRSRVKTPQCGHSPWCWAMLWNEKALRWTGWHCHHADCRRPAKVLQATGTGRVVRGVGGEA